MTTKAIQVPTTELAREGSRFIAIANALVVSSGETLQEAGGVLRGIKTSLAAVAETFDKPIKDAHAAHKSMIAARDLHRKPRLEAERIIKVKIGAYQAEEERKRREEEQWLREIARKEEEDRRLAEAVRLEQEQQPEAAEAVLAAPIATPVVVVPSQTPKVEGVSTRKIWKFRIVNPAMIPPAFLAPDLTKIGSHGRSMKEAASIPGVEFYSEESVAATAY